MADLNSFTLSELTSQVEETIRLNFDSPVWIRADVSELRENPGGHCYLELVEKDEYSDTFLAKCKATIWASTYRMLKPYFESSTGQSLRAGLKVLVAVSVEFHGLYGFSLNIRDIDPTFTLGDMAARRQLVIKQLQQDGIMDMNKLIPLPALVQRIAIISSETAAGYDDFCDQINQNTTGFVFYKRLFPAVMQGEQAEASIIAALERIFEHSALFDVVVIIRGGGATADLACFDSYELALNCAQFPLPVIAGIGHQRDVSVLDMVAHTSVKTPTAAAEFLLSCLQNVEQQLFDVFSDIHSLVATQITQQQHYIDRMRLRIHQNLRSWVVQRSHRIETQHQRLRNACKMHLMKQTNMLMMLEKKIEPHSPAFLLKHGYTITTINGKRITSAVNIKAGEKVRTYLADGDFESEVI